MYKSLNSEDIVVGKFPIIEPAGADDGGALRGSLVRCE